MPATKDEEYSNKSNTALIKWQVQIRNGYCQTSTKKHAFSDRVFVNMASAQEPIEQAVYIRPAAGLWHYRSQ